MEQFLKSLLKKSVSLTIAILLVIAFVFLSSAAYIVIAIVSVVIFLGVIAYGIFHLIKSSIE